MQPEDAHLFDTASVIAEPTLLAAVVPFVPSCAGWADVMTMVKSCTAAFAALPPSEGLHLIFVADGSLDCGESPKGLLARDCPSQVRITLVSTGSRSGPGIARNLGASKADGLLLVFLDVDDQVDWRALYQESLVLQQSSADLLVAGFREATLSSACGRSIKRRGIPHDADRSLFRLLVKRVGVWRIIFRSSLIAAHDLNFPSRAYGEDLVFMVDVVMTRPRLQWSDQVWYTHELSVVGSASKSPTLSQVHGLVKDLAIRFPRVIAGRNWSLAALIVSWQTRILLRAIVKPMGRFVQGSQSSQDGTSNA